MPLQTQFALGADSENPSVVNVNIGRFRYEITLVADGGPADRRAGFLSWGAMTGRHEDRVVLRSPQMNAEVLFNTAKVRCFSRRRRPVPH